MTLFSTAAANLGFDLVTYHTSDVLDESERRWEFTRLFTAAKYANYHRTQVLSYHCAVINQEV